MYLIPSNHRDESDKSWNGRPMKLSKTEDIDKEFEPLKKLIQVIRDDPVINEKVIKMLQMDSYQRRAVLNNWLEQLRRNNAPQKLMQSLSCFFDDSIAEKVRILISVHQIKNSENNRFLNDS